MRRCCASGQIDHVQWRQKFTAYSFRLIVGFPVSNAQKSGTHIAEATDIHSPEWAALLECASPHRDPSRFPELLCASNLPVLLTLAVEHGVIALFAARASNAPEDVIPPPIVEQIRERHRAQIVSTLKLTAELFRLIEIFRSANLETMVVKGPALAARAYGDPGARNYGDLDLLLRHRDIGRATELMTAAGYEGEISLEAIRAEKIPGQYLFVRTSSPLIVELHTERTMRYFPRLLPIEEFFARRAEVLIDGHAIPALSPEDELVLICIHGAKHLWERLTLVSDVAAYVTRQADLSWARTFASARAIGAERMLNIGLLLARDLVQASLPQPVSTAIDRDSAARSMAAQITAWLPSGGRVQPGLLSRAGFRMRMRGGFLPGMAYLLRLTLSPTQEDWLSDEVKRGGVIESLRRPVRLAKKYGPGGKDS